LNANPERDSAQPPAPESPADGAGLRLMHALQGMDCGFWELDLAADEIRWWNDWCDQFGIDPCVGAHHSARWERNVHPDDLQTLNARYQAMLGGAAALYEIEYRLRTRSGPWRWILCRGRITHRDAADRPVRVTGVLFDIDNRKRAELALRESEARLEAAVSGTEIGLWESDALGSFRWFNDWCTQLGIDPCEGEDQQLRWNLRIHPDDLARYVGGLSSAYTGGTDHYVVEYRIRTVENRWRWLHERGKVTQRDGRGRAICVAGVCFDIDVRKQMEAALHQAERRYQIAIDSARLPVWEWDVVNDVLTGNIHWHRASGYTHLSEEEAALRTETGFSDVHPEDLPSLQHRWEDHQANGVELYESEYRLRTPDGSYKWMLTRGFIVERDPDGRPTKVVGIGLDIDSRKRMELALHTQAMILETMREGVVLIGIDGRIEFTNPALDAMFGYAAGALVGRRVVDLIRTRGGARAPRAIETLLKRFDVRQGRRSLPFRRLDGSEFTAEVLFGSLAMQGEKKTPVVLQDVSERKLLEREVTEITHREQRRLGSDLHDGLGQELTGISLMMRGLARRIAGVAAELSPEVDEIIAVVNQAIESTRSMARGISPIRLEGGSLVPALNQLAARLRTAHKVEIRLELALRSMLALDEASATHLYLIAQEAITNALRHGRARVIVVKLRTTRNVVSLSIADDGSGMPQAGSPAAGMGLKIMEYRAGIIGGTLQISGRRTGGTRVRCVCPQAPRPRAAASRAKRVP
jgi:PAS domain S-box-containing protein